MKALACIAAWSIIAGLALPTPSRAQEPQQTPENAQRFLATTQPQASMGVPRVGTSPFWVEPATTSLRPVSDVCITANSFRGENGSMRDDGEIRWREVVEVRREDDSTKVRLTYTNTYLHDFTFASASLAARAAFAMEFLRQHCDPAAGTGF